MERKSKIIFTAEFDELAEELLFILYEEEYFGFIEEDAAKYVNKIYDFIEENIDNYPTKSTSAELAQYGEKYLTYKANKQTVWYIFFSQIEQYYFVTFITNNHTKLYAELNL